jgi:hypothetical protein
MFNAEPTITATVSERRTDRVEKVRFTASRRGIVMRSSMVAALAAGGL